MIKIGPALFSETPILEKEALVAIGDHRFFVISKSSTIFFESEDDKIIGLKAKTPDGEISEKKRLKVRGIIITNMPCLLH